MIALKYMFAKYSKCTSMLYSHHQTLQELLVAQNWQEADLETKRLTFQVNSEDLNSDSGLSVRKELIPKIKAFSNEELEEIDRLWLEHSNGHFGFSVQWQIYQDILAEEKDLGKAVVIEKYPIAGRWSAMSALAIVIRWLSAGADEWSFDRETYYAIDAPKGHLPTVGKQELGCAFHHGYLLSWVFSNLYRGS